MGFFDFYYSKPIVKYRTSDGKVLPFNRGLSSVDLFPEKIIAENDDWLFIYDTGVTFEIPEGFYGLIIESPDLCEKGYNIANNVSVVTPDMKETVKVKLVRISSDAEMLTHDTAIAKVIILPISSCEFVKIDE